MDEQSLETSILSPPLVEAQPLRLLVPALLVIAGMLVLGVLAYRERAWIDTQVWKDALIVRSSGDIPDGAIAARMRFIDASNFPGTPELELAGNSLLPNIDWNPRERLTALDMPDGVWATVIESGSVPAPNSNEVIAGALCRLNTFSVDGQVFTVVGKLQSGTPGLSFSYLCRESEAMIFLMHAEGEPGWIDPQGQTRAHEELESEIDENASIVMPFAPVSKPVSFVALGAIALIVCGAGFAQVRIVRHLAKHFEIVRWFVAPAIEYRGLFIAMHALCYGAYFVPSIVAVWAPVQNLTLLTIVSGFFTEGDLSHIGDAYISGNVFAAAWATFYNNFIVQTLYLSILPSLLIPFIGVLKTAFSLLIAGFALSPIWTSLIEKMTFHSVTLSFECEAYIFAAFAMSAYVLYIVRWFNGKRESFTSAIQVVVSGTLLSAAILIIAALFEAATLIAWS
ncbi:MAG: hypothetical protein SGI88_14490 [Candidatus Hydrogenedentes bacterium]|nr:hypothetical protein [Candidatus Hydrogenedentota bacterium]